MKKILFLLLLIPFAVCTQTKHTSQRIVEEPNGNMKINFIREVIDSTLHIFNPKKILLENGLLDEVNIKRARRNPGEKVIVKSDTSLVFKSVFTKTNYYQSTKWIRFNIINGRHMRFDVLEVGEDPSILIKSKSNVGILVIVAIFILVIGLLWKADSERDENIFDIAFPIFLSALGGGIVFAIANDLSSLNMKVLLLGGMYYLLLLLAFLIRKLVIKQERSP